MNYFIWVISFYIGLNIVYIIDLKDNLREIHKDNYRHWLRQSVLVCFEHTVERTRIHIQVRRSQKGPLNTCTRLRQNILFRSKRGF